jgi:hypothetical protein
MDAGRGVAHMVLLWPTVKKCHPTVLTNYWMGVIFLKVMVVGGGVFKSIWGGVCAAECRPAAGL